MKDTDSKKSDAISVDEFLKENKDEINNLTTEILDFINTTKQGAGLVYAAVCLVRKVVENDLQAALEFEGHQVNWPDSKIDMENRLQDLLNRRSN